jgi:hypothetical protein
MGLAMAATSRRLIFTPHVLDAMREREISKKSVRTAVDNHDTTYPGTHRTRDTIVKVGTASDGRRLCVVVDAKKERVVVTSYWA